MEQLDRNTAPAARGPIRIDETLALLDAVLAASALPGRSAAIAARLLADRATAAVKADRDGR